MAFKQKKRTKNSKSKYLRPGALAQIRYSRATNRSCTHIGKKRVVLDTKKAKLEALCQGDICVISTPVASPNSTSLCSMVRLGDGIRSHKSPVTPKTPLSTECDAFSGLESLPMDMLVKILCHLHHDQLKAVFHVSRRIRKAALLARQYHFNYTTPDRSRQEMLNSRTPRPTEHWPFMSKGDGNGVQGFNPQTPKAPRHGLRNHRLHVMDMSQIAAVLFQESALPSRLLVPPGLPRPICKSGASNRVLYYEDELCQAVAQNKLH